MVYHIPVMAKECLEALDIRPDGVYVDATFGGGGHSALILAQLGDKGRLIGFDQDDDALANVLQDERFTFVHHNFRFLQRFLRLHGIRQVDGILADLGVSSHQLDEGERGFSYRFDAELDMRMNRADGITAATVLNTYDAAALQDLFSRFGEVRNSRTLAQRIVESRRAQPLHTIGDFLALLDPLVMGLRPRYLSQVFQALRMEVNDEMGALADFLTDCKAVLKPGGRLAIMSYHSIEDRLVKHFLKTGNPEGAVEQDFYGHISKPFKLITKKAVLPDAAEQKQNPRSRSAKLRIAEGL